MTAVEHAEPGARLAPVGPARPTLADEHDLPARRLEADFVPAGAIRSARSIGCRTPCPPIRPRPWRRCAGCATSSARVPGRDAREAQGRALELIAERSREQERARIRLDAARAYTAAGERDAARRMLTGIADDRAAPGTIAAGASATLVQVLIGEGKLDEAARRLAEHRSDMGGDEYADAPAPPGRWATSRRATWRSADSALRGGQHGGWPRARGAAPALPGRHRRRHRAVQGGRAVRRRPRRGHRANRACSRCCSRSKRTASRRWARRCSRWRGATPPGPSPGWTGRRRAAARQGRGGGAPARRPARGRDRQGRRRGAAAQGRRGAGRPGHRARGRAGAGGAAASTSAVRARRSRSWST